MGVTSRDQTRHRRRAHRARRHREQGQARGQRHPRSPWPWRSCAPSRARPARSTATSARRQGARSCPVPCMNIINGGKHADNSLGLQEFMVAPARLRQLLRGAARGGRGLPRPARSSSRQGGTDRRGDEGGFAPILRASIRRAGHRVILRAIEEAGYRPGAGTCHRPRRRRPASSHGGRGKGRPRPRARRRPSAPGDVEYASGWTKYPIISHRGRALARTTGTGGRISRSASETEVQLVGDDIFVTNPMFIARGIARRTCNAVLIKLNQIGTVSETQRAVTGWRSTRAGGPWSPTVRGKPRTPRSPTWWWPCGCGLIKTGSAVTLGSYRQVQPLLRIEEG